MSTVTLDPYQSGLNKMIELADSTRSSRNEDTTRFQLIDPLLVDCLRHPKANIETEIAAHPGYADYIIGSPARLMVIEAKREGSTFKLPADLAGRPTISLATLREDPSAAEAIDQVTRYAQQLGIGLAGIANGTQLAIFLASRSDGKEVAKGEAIAFVSLEEMRDNFRRLWDLLSRSALTQRTAQQILMMGSAGSQPPHKLSASIKSYPGFRLRSERETDLKLLSTVFIQDIEGNAEVSDEFLRECYYSSGTLSQYAFVSKEILRVRYDNLPGLLGLQTEPVQGKKGINPALRRDLISSAVTSKPLVLLGDVGVGKTMFIRHLLRVDAADELRDHLVFYVDFGREPALNSQLRAHIVEAVNDQLDRTYGIDIEDNGFVRGVYNRELNRFKKGIYGSLAKSDPAEFVRQEIAELARLVSDRGKHVERSLQHLEATSRRRSVIVLDNLDQRPLDFQDEAFLIAQAMSSTLAATIFVSLRPTTFFESKLRGSLAAYQPRAFHVAPARVSSVISRRLAFARKQLLGDERATELSINVRDLEAYLDALEEGFTSNETLLEILENMSGGNTRLALEYLSSFIGSGYVETARILDVAKEGRVYVIPVHEFMRSIILGENDLYDPSTSRILNLFDISESDPREHFVLPLLLALIQTNGDPTKRAGFVEPELVFAEAQKWGFAPEQIEWHLSRAVDKGLLDSTPGHSGPRPYRITSIGAYMYREMATMFTYADAVVVDTPIIDPSIRSAILDVRAVEDRLDRANAFCDYLNDAWTGFGNPAALPFDWNVQGSRLRRDITIAKEKAVRARERRDSQRPSH
jgi:predicted type IV restriction endonuclease